MLFQLDSELCTIDHDEDPESTLVISEGKKKPTSTEGCQNNKWMLVGLTHKFILLTLVWGYGILFVTLISGCSLVGVSVLPMVIRMI